MQQDREFKPDHAAAIQRARSADPSAPPTTVVYGMIKGLESPSDFKSADLDSYEVTVIGGNHTIAALKSELLSFCISLYSYNFRAQV